MKTIQDKSISYENPIGPGVIRTTLFELVESYKKDLQNQKEGKWVSEELINAQIEALKNEGIDPLNVVITKDTETPKTQKPVDVKKIKKVWGKTSYVREIEEQGDINNLLRRNGCAAAAE